MGGNMNALPVLVEGKGAIPAELEVRPPTNNNHNSDSETTHHFFDNEVSIEEVSESKDKQSKNTSAIATATAEATADVKKPSDQLEFTHKNDVQEEKSEKLPNKIGDFSDQMFDQTQLEATTDVLEVFEAFKNYSPVLGPDVLPDEETIKLMYMKSTYEGQDEHVKQEAEYLNSLMIAKMEARIQQRIEEAEDQLIKEK